MSNAADYDRYGHQGWDRPAFSRPGWHPVWIAAVVLGFIFWWPIGLALLFYTLWSRKMGCRSHRWDEKVDRFRSRMNEGFGRWNAPTSGNHAFDEYRSETLKRLEDEQREFKDFLDRLRHAKDKSEFDQFMAERRNRPTPSQPQP